MVVFADEKTVFFTLDHADAVTEAGGCTQAWWDSEVAASDEATALAKLMGANGLPLINNSNLDYTHSTKRIDAALAGDFTNVEVGMVAYVTGLYLTTGRYKITEAYDDYIILSGIVSTADYNDTVLVIGGAFDDLQDALDETDATNHSTTIYVRSIATLAASIDIDMGGGNNTKNTFKKLSGYNTSPGDMNFGETYYQSPNEILQAGAIDNTKAVLFDGNNNNFTIINISIDGLILENIHFYNSGIADPVVFNATPQGIVFRNCRVSLCERVSASAAVDVVWDSLYIHNDMSKNHCILTGGHHSFINCVVNLTIEKNFIHATGITVSIINCLVAGNGNFVIRPLAGTSILLVNNTFYNLVFAAVGEVASDDIVAFNNIFALDSSVGAVAFDLVTSGMMSYNDYNCFIEVDETPLTIASSDSGIELPTIGKHSIAVDPQFMDPGNGDFRLKPTSPCLNTGRPTIDAGSINMGAWNRISRIRR